MQPKTPQLACDRCSVGVMDADNPQLHGLCTCHCHGDQPAQEYLADLISPTYPTEDTVDWGDGPSTIGDLIEALANADCTDIEADEDALRIDFAGGFAWGDVSNALVFDPMYLKLTPCASLDEIEVLEAQYEAWDAAFDAASEALACRDAPCMCCTAVQGEPRRCAWNALDPIKDALHIALDELEAAKATRGLDTELL
jgi:hypothetical protein